MYRDKELATLGALAGFGGLTAAAACCVLPLAFASLGVGIGISTMAKLMPWHTPLSIVAALAVAIAWAMHFRRRRACAIGSECEPPARSTLVLLTAASFMVACSAAWPLLEPSLMKLFQ